MKQKSTRSMTNMEKAVKAVYHRDGGVSMTIPNIRMNHLDLFLKWRTAPELLELGIYTAREITESVAMRQAAVRKLGIDPTHPDVTCVIVGDGGTPRTGALVAYTTRWFAVSVDPYLKNPSRFSHVKRLRVRGEAIQSYVRHTKNLYVNTMIVMAPHTHTELETTTAWGLRHCDRLHVIANPCCYDLMLSEEEYGEPTMEYDDWGIVSGHRRIQIYKDVRRK